MPWLPATSCLCLGLLMWSARADEPPMKETLPQAAAGFTVIEVKLAPEPGKSVPLPPDALRQFLRPDLNEILSTTIGTHFEFPGRDVRERCAGPDGRFYFFCGEGGASLQRKEGGILRIPNEGAVLRSEADGSHLEIFCGGLNDPRGLAFDEWGNLFTIDTASGLGDEDRILALVEHGDYGWRAGWPHPALDAARTPWMAEKLWTPRFDGQPAWMLPAVGNIPVGTSSLVHYPGTGFPPRYEDHFFTGNFRLHTLSAWSAQPNGAVFRPFDQHDLVTDAVVLSLAFGQDGGLYFTSQNARNWDPNGVRLFGLRDSSPIPDAQSEATVRLLAEGLRDKTPLEWRDLLRSPDQRVRLEAEWALVTAPDGEIYLREAALAPKVGPDPLVARLHGIWGLGLMARRADEKTPGARARMLEPLVPLLDDEEPEVRAQAARVFGELRVGVAFDGLIKALRSPEERVSQFAAEALGRLGRDEARSQLLLMVREAGNHDPFLRHAYVDALLGLPDSAAIEEAAQESSPAVRLAALLAMRRLARPEIARFLQDDEPTLVLEAARAIHDENIAGALPALAALIDHPIADEALMVRVLNADFRNGQPENATALAAFAAREEAGAALRIDALKLLGFWPHPPATDYVTGSSQAATERDAAPAREALGAILTQLLAAKSADVVNAAAAARDALQQSPK